MIDDLTSRGVTEPYRMFTSRAEFRLSLRADNADQRLTPMALELGIVSAERRAAFLEKTARIEAVRTRLAELFVTPNEAGKFGLIINKDGVRRSAFELLAYPDIGFDHLAAIWPELGLADAATREALEIDARYSVYLERQQADIALLRREESLAIPADIDFSAVPGLSNELRQKMAARKPATIAAAQKIEGMTPAALAIVILLVRQCERGVVAGAA
jgi:tRNA uridine 5-carboxymethylaminomethyl modification enzyme